MLFRSGEAVPGFSAVDAIAQQLGVTTAEAMDMISAGAIDATTGVNALLVGMQKFPGAAGAMEKQSQTLLGVFSTFKDTVGQALADAFTPVIPAIKDALTGLTPVLGDALKVFVPALGDLLASLLPIISTIIKALAPFLGIFLKLINIVLVPLIPILDKVGVMFGDALTKVLVALTPVLVDLVTPLGDVLLALIPLIPAIADLLVALVPIAGVIVKALAGLLSLLAIKGLVPLVNLLVTGLNLLIPPIAAFAGWLENIDWGKTGKEIGGAFGKAWEVVKNFFVNIGRFFRDLPGNILSFIKSLPQRFAQLITDMFKAALFALGVGIGLLIAGIIGIPKGVEFVFTQLPGIIAGLITKAFTMAIDITLALGAKLIEIIVTLGPKILAGLVAFPGKLFTFFSNMWDKAVDIGRTAIEKIVGFVIGLPGRLGGFSEGVANSIFNFFKRALNGAISAVNSGIAAVDDKLPGISLPRLPLLAKGGIAVGPAIIGEAGQPEAAIPLHDNRALTMLTNAFAKASPGAASSNITVVVEIDGQQLQGRIVKTIDESNRTIQQRVMSRRNVT